MSSQVPDHCFKPLSQSQLELVWQWRNSERIQNNMHNNQPVAWQDHCEWFDGVQQDTTRKFFVLWQQQRPIGVLNFSGLDTATPEWGCYLGETNVWPGSGIILESAALDYAANFTQFSHLLAQVLSFNNAANKMHKVFEYQKVKTQYGGERNGQKFDVWYYSYCLEEWRKKRSTILTKLPKNIGLAAEKLKFLE